MKPWLGLVVLVGICFGIAPAGQSRAEETASDSTDERLQQIKDLLEQSVDWYDVFATADGKDGLRPQVVLRWRNAERTNTGAAVLAIWTDRGRPEAMASIFQNRNENRNEICHEFGSLSRSKIVVRDKTRVVWSPGKAGVEFHDVPDAPPPAEDGAARLRQMKSLAGRFAARKFGEGNAEVLRLLPRPLYRYDLKTSKDTDPILRDGGMFSFVMGTDPEVVLLLEAVEREGKALWQYAFARATAYAVEASLGDRVVWSDSAQWDPNPTNSLMQVFRPIPQ